MKLLTFNIHKGYTILNTRFMLHELREAIREVRADLVFLQEVQGEHSTKAERESDWPDKAQYEFLADEVWHDHAYGKNVAYQEGHHGNAILSHFPIKASQQVDVSTNRIEGRGFLWCAIEIPEGGPMHAICVHLGLSAMGRRKQLRAISEFVQTEIPPELPLVIAGDTNDWSGLPTRAFARDLKLVDAYEAVNHRRARSFPSFAPILCLDRIFVRGMSITAAEVHRGGKWAELSDHAALTADVELAGESASSPG